MLASFFSRSSSATCARPLPRYVTGPRSSTLHCRAADITLEGEMAAREGNGDWRGSIVDDEAVAQLRRDGFLGTEDNIAVRGS